MIRWNDGQGNISEYSDMGVKMAKTRGNITPEEQIPMYPIACKIRRRC